MTSLSASPRNAGSLSTRWRSRCRLVRVSLMPMCTTARLRLVCAGRSSKRCCRTGSRVWVGWPIGLGHLVNGIPVYDVCSVSTQQDYLIVDTSGFRGLVPNATSYPALEVGLCYRQLPSGGLREEVSCDQIDAELLVGIATEGGCLDLVERELPESDPGGWTVSNAYPIDKKTGTKIYPQDWCFVDPAEFTWLDGAVVRS